MCSCSLSCSLVNSCFFRFYCEDRCVDGNGGDGNLLLLVSFLPSHCLAHHPPTHQLAPFLQVQKMNLFLVLQVRKTKNWTPWEKKTKKKFHFLKESIFGLLNWSNYNFGHLRHGNHMAMTKKNSNFKKELKLKPSPIFEKRSQNQTKIGPFWKC